jgi:hypothetical protein
MWLAVVVSGFGAGDVLHLRQRQEVAMLGRIQDVGCGDRHPLPRPQRTQLDRADVVTVDADATRPVLEQHGESAGGPMRSEHSVEHRERDPRLMTELAYPPSTGIQETPLGCRRRQWVPRPVVGTDPIAELPVQAGASELLNPGMLVGRDRLRGELPTNPIGLLRKHDLAA